MTNASAAPAPGKTQGRRGGRILDNVSIQYPFLHAAVVPLSGRSFMDPARDSWTRRPSRTEDPGYGSPSPDEIRATCQEIQRDWSEKERRRRAGQPRNFVRILECPSPMLLFPGQR
jgi:hypothetical protein